MPKVCLNSSSSQCRMGSWFLPAFKKKIFFPLLRSCWGCCICSELNFSGILWVGRWRTTQSGKIFKNTFFFFLAIKAPPSTPPPKQSLTQNMWTLHLNFVCAYCTVWQALLGHLGKIYVPKMKLRKIENCFWTSVAVKAINSYFLYYFNMEFFHGC